MKLKIKADRVPKAKFFAIAAAAALAGVSSAHASLLASESFNYATAGASLNGQGSGFGFTGTWGGGANFDVVTGLTYPGVTTSGGAASGSGQTYLSLASTIAPTSGSIYISLLTSQGSANFDDVTIFNNGGVGEMFSFGDTYTGSAASTVYSLYSSSGLGNSGYVASAANVDTSGAVHLLVAQIDYSTANAPIVSLFLDPTTATPTAIASFTANGFAGAFNQIRLEDRNFAMDEIRIGTSLADVTTSVPEPGIFSLLGLAAPLLAYRMRRRNG